ncbi:hypothetical protein [Solilutibacter silvestris]|uniref:hypothetical protein n=1 Tax=Solilutibacter silvestris TaxID=1645665 RepID=UPI0013FD1E0B|nr:hypothetical protein [Lysobacter silvestris]
MKPRIIKKSSIPKLEELLKGVTKADFKKLRSPIADRKPTLADWGIELGGGHANQKK